MMAKRLLIITIGVLVVLTFFPLTVHAAVWNPVENWNFILQSPTWHIAESWNFNLQTPDSAYEDFRTYTEVDPNSRITISQILVDANGLKRNEDAYVYKDKGVDYFVNFEHEVDVRSPSYIALYGVVLVWGVSNVVDDVYAWTWGFSLEVYGVSTSQYDLRFRKKIGSSGWGTGDNSTPINHGTWSYITIKRDGASLTCKIYSNNERTNLVETLSLTVGIVEKYRYIYACSSWNTATPQTFNADISKLHLQETETREWYSVENWAFNLQTPEPPPPPEWRFVESWSFNLQTSADWWQVESWTFNLNSIAEWGYVESWNFNLHSPSTGGTDTFYVGGSYDDAYETGTGYFTETSCGVYAYSFTDTTSVSYRCSGFRFPNVTVPQGANVLAMKFSGYVFSGFDANFKIYGNDVDNALDFNQHKQIINQTERPRTSAFVSWVAGDLSVGWHDKTGLEDIGDEIFGRDNWSKGNALVLLFIGNTDVEKKIEFEAYDEGEGYAAKLEIMWDLSSTIEWRRVESWNFNLQALSSPEIGWNHVETFTFNIQYTSAYWYYERMTLWLGLVGVALIIVSPPLTVYFLKKRDLEKAAFISVIGFLFGVGLTIGWLFA